MVVRKQRRFERERQPLLPLNQVAREINKRDSSRETQPPQQLELMPSTQQDLFSETEK